MIASLLATICRLGSEHGEQHTGSSAGAGTARGWLLVGGAGQRGGEQQSAMLQRLLATVLWQSVIRFVKSLENEIKRILRDGVFI